MEPPEPPEANRDRTEDERLPKVAAVKMAVREGGKRMMDNILPSFVELVKESPSLKGEASNATYNIMKAHNLTLEEISCLLFAAAYLDQKRLTELQSRMEKDKGVEKTLREDLRDARREIDMIQEETEQEKQKLRDAHNLLMKEFEEFRKNSVLNVQVQQLQERNSVLEEDNCRLRRERSELTGRLEREKHSTESFRSRSRTLEQQLYNFQSTMQGVYRQIAPYRYQMTRRKNLQECGRPHSDPSIAVGNEGNSRFYADSRKPVHNSGLTSREALAETTLMARRGHRVDPLADGLRRNQSRPRPPDEQVVGSFPLLPIQTPLRSPPIASSSSRVSSASDFSVVNDTSVLSVERPAHQLVYQDGHNGGIPLSGEQVQTDGRAMQLVCPLCSVVFKDDVFNALSHITECRVH